MTTNPSLKDLIDYAILGFELDPADSDFQRGYLAALMDLRNEWERVVKEEY